MAHAHGSCPGTGECQHRSERQKQGGRESQFHVKASIPFTILLIARSEATFLLYTYDALGRVPDSNLCGGTTLEPAVVPSPFSCIELGQRWEVEMIMSAAGPVVMLNLLDFSGGY
jgi:hypothetical protein